jgi:hypothetical protein
MRIVLLSDGNRFLSSYLFIPGDRTNLPGSSRLQAYAMDKTWAKKFWIAQRRTHCVVNGVRTARIRYGDEGRRWCDSSIPCHDCGARRGHYHGPGCDMERCPACRQQWISCACTHDCPDDHDTEQLDD